MPILWLEAGTKQTLTVRLSMMEESRYNFPQNHNLVACKLKTGHRLLASAKVPSTQTQNGVSIAWSLHVETLQSGTSIKAELLIEEQTVRNVLIVSSDPFENRNEWFTRHPIALYDPKGKTAIAMKNLDFPYRQLNSFADIASTETETIIVGEGISFEKSRGLAELLYEKAASGCGVLVLAPNGAIPINFESPIFSLQLLENPQTIFPQTSHHRTLEGWILQGQKEGTFLVPHSAQQSKASSSILEAQRESKIVFGNPRLLDVVFIQNDDFQAKPSGRIIIEKFLCLSEKNAGNIESRYYFKSLIETLTKEKP
ncbi:MAG: hypothetical protein LBI18_10385 [Planctomycetaceae bacterium]|nr:hypothetical protein [Planctomycetaceae bacterium]